jgi:two-component system cell cycle response regulator
VEQVSDTWVTTPQRIEKSLRDACLVHIYPTGQAMGSRHPLNGAPVVLGRGEDCEVQIDEHSVSRRHARVELGNDAFIVADLQSTNGTFVNDSPIIRAKLTDGDYLRVGNCIYRFLCGGNVESQYHEEIYRLTIIDALTGAHNRRSMLEFLDRELSRSARHQRPMALLMIDIDHFKKVNDDLGHLGGDVVLRELTAIISATIRKEDLFARYGGEEFALVLVETPDDQAREVAERVREAVAAKPIKCDGKLVPLTVSLGLACSCGDPDLTVIELIRRADVQLATAKAEGRNRVCG